LHLYCPNIKEYTTISSFHDSFTSGSWLVVVVKLQVLKNGKFATNLLQTELTSTTIRQKSSLETGRMKKKEGKG